MKTRTVDITYVMRGPTGLQKVQFDLACHPDTRLVQTQAFEIVSPGVQTVSGTLVQVVNRSDGTTSVRMIGGHDGDFASVLARLRDMPQVRIIRVN